MEALDQQQLSHLPLPLAPFPVAHCNSKLSRGVTGREGGDLDLAHMTRGSAMSINQSYRKKLSLGNLLVRLLPLSPSLHPAHLPSVFLSMLNRLIMHEIVYIVLQIISTNFNFKVSNLLSCFASFDTFLRLLIASIWPID